MESHDQLRQQIEIFFSNSFLQKNEAFYKHITSNLQNSVAVDFILDHHSIKALKAKKEDILSAAKSSEILTLTKNHQAIYLKTPKIIPPFKPKKRLQSDYFSSDDPKAITIGDSKSPYLFLIKTKSEELSDFQLIEKKLNKLFPSFKILYIRINHCHGHILISSANTTLEEVMKLDGFKGVSKGHRFLIKYATKEQSKEFYKKHGSHFMMLLSQKAIEGRNETRKARKKAISELTKAVHGPFVIGSKSYETIKEIKEKAKEILNINKIGDEVTGADYEFVMGLLAFHPKKEALVKDLKKIIIGSHPLNVSSKCLFCAKDHDINLEFSIVKCIESMISEKAKEECAS